MKKNVLKLLLVLPALSILTGCTPATNNPIEPNENTPSSPVVPDEGETDIVDEESPIDYITLSDREIIVKVGKKSSTPIVNFYPASVPSELHDVTWEIEDTSIATCDQYGRVSGVKKGKTNLVCTTVSGHRKAKALVEVINTDEDLTYEYQKVTDYTSIAAGDIIVLACPEKNMTATLENTGMYLHAVNSTFSSDKSKLLSLGENTIEFMVDGSTNNFTLETQTGKLLATTNEKKVTFVNKVGNVRWAFTNDEGNIYIESTSNVPGWIMYNDQDPRFANYESNASSVLYFPSVYRLTRV